jgi:hypothetical protein
MPIVLAVTRDHLAFLFLTNFPPGTVATGDEKSMRLISLAKGSLVHTGSIYTLRRSDHL